MRYYELVPIYIQACITRKIIEGKNPTQALKECLETLEHEIIKEILG